MERATGRDCLAGAVANHISRGMFDYADDPRMLAALTRQIANSERAIANLEKLENDPDFATA